MEHKFFWLVFLFLILGVLKMNVVTHDCLAAMYPESNATYYHTSSMQKKINFVVKGKRSTLNAKGWDEYDGSIYNTERGYGWLTDLAGNGRDRGADASILLADGTKTSSQDLGRLELANWQGTHKENEPIVFRIDVPDGWYRITCTSVDPGGPLPLVDQRCFKCRAHDVVFAGANYGKPLVAKGNCLAEGTGVVEVTDGHLRIVVGDPAYGGWTWAYVGPWYTGWKRWLRKGHLYAGSWHQKFTRVVDPGFHTLRLNSLEVERVPPPEECPTLVFRDFFNRDNGHDVNSGVLDANHWVKVKLHPGISDNINTQSYQTSIRLTTHNRGSNVVGLLQKKLSPEKGVVRYSTQVSLFMGEGSQKYLGSQEAGIVMLAEPSEPTEFGSTFVGVAIDDSGSGTMGWLIYRIGDGEKGYRTNLKVPDTTLPFEITEGEFEIIVDHDVAKNVLRQIRVNGVDLTDQWSFEDRTQRVSQGMFGIRGATNISKSKASLHQFYWYYSVQVIKRL